MEEMEKKNWIYKEADKVLCEQLATVDTLNTKVNTLLAVCGVLLALFSAIVMNDLLLIGLPGLAGTIIAVFVLLFAYKIKDWNTSSALVWLKWHFARNTKLEDMFTSAIECIQRCYQERSRPKSWWKFGFGATRS